MRFEIFIWIRKVYILGRNVSGVLICFFVLLICFFSEPLRVQAQNARAFIDLSVSPSKVYAGQPAILTYTVYTDQYFTQPPEVSNLQMDGAFLVPYDRSYSLFLQKGGKNLPAIQFKFRIFPVQAGKLTLPPLNFTVTMPTEKNPLGVEQKIKSHGLTLNVLNPPGGPPGESIVGSSASLTEKWSKPLASVKEGDVIERDIIINAGGTVAGLLPEVTLDSLDWAQIYEATPVTKDNRPPGSDAISAYRTEKFRYLFSKTGKHTLPEVTVNFWNLSTHKLSKLKIPAKEIEVHENKNLGILRSIQDSLDKAFLKATDPHAAKAAPTTYFGLTPKQWLFLLIGVGILWFIVRRLILPITRSVRNKWYHYKQSEHFLFINVRRKALFSDSLNTYNALGKWMLALPGGIKSMQDLSAQTGLPQLTELSNTINNDLFKESTNETTALKHSSLFPLLSKARKALLRKYEAKEVKMDYRVLNEGSI